MPYQAGKDQVLLPGHDAAMHELLSKRKEESSMTALERKERRIVLMLFIALYFLCAALAMILSARESGGSNWPSESSQKLIPVGR
jgi:hypothetical protein